VQRVLAESREVDGIGQEPPVVADRVDAEREECVALGHAIEIERDLLGRAGHVAPPAMDRVLLAGLRARVVHVLPAPVGHGDVVLLDPREHLLVERVLEGLGALHHGVGVRVLGLEVGDHLGIVLGSQPVVLVLDPLAVQLADGRDALRHGGRRAHRVPIVLRAPNREKMAAPWS